MVITSLLPTTGVHITQQPREEEFASDARIPADHSRSLRAIRSGLSWNTVSQIIAIATNLALTPFLLFHLGLAAYGAFAFIASFRGLLSNLDGGLGPCATRYFAVYAGAKDRRSTSSLLVTMSLLVFLVIGIVAAAAVLLAPDVTVVLHTSAGLKHEATELIRAFMALYLVSTLSGLLSMIIAAEHRWAYLNVTAIISLLVYVGLAVTLVEQGHGLWGLFWASVGSQAVTLTTAVVGARRYVSIGAFRVMTWAQTRELIRYASRVQIAEVASSFNLEIDALLVGLLFPVGDVALYAIGSNFSSALINLPMNAIGPIQVALSRTFGRLNLRGTLEEFARLQRVWVRAIAAFAVVGAVSVVVAIPKWLGPAERLAGVVAAVLLLGQAVQLLCKVMDALGKSINRPGLESRYLGVGMVVNIALTVPLAFSIGMLGVPIGTAVGVIASALYFLHIARRKITPDIPSFLSEVPKLAVAVSVLVTALLELPAYWFAPRGAAGLLLCALPAVAGLSVYAVITFGIDDLRRLYNERIEHLMGVARGAEALVEPASHAPLLSAFENSPTGTIPAHLGDLHPPRSSPLAEGGGADVPTP
ncbi:MAG TPA: oligosaccharide flippase family protein [Acidimicrobiales bacterium]|nr:oligosaccharide flippase family protein [Acidimicrobiales bacterium]